MAFHKAFWHLNNPDTQFCAIRKQFPLEASRELHSKIHYFEYVLNIFNFHTRRVAWSFFSSTHKYIWKGSKPSEKYWVLYFSK